MRILHRKLLSDEYLHHNSHYFNKAYTCSISHTMVNGEVVDHNYDFESTIGIWWLHWNINYDVVDRKIMPLFMLTNSTRTIITDGSLYEFIAVVSRQHSKDGVPTSFRIRDTGEFGSITKHALTYPINKLLGRRH